MKKLTVLLSAVAILTLTAPSVNAGRVFDGSPADGVYLQQQIDKQNEEAQRHKQEREMRQLQESIDTLNRAEDREQRNIFKPGRKLGDPIFDLD